jgi:hypothetical protein
MPSGIYPVPQFHPHPSANPGAHQSFVVRMLTRRKRRRLDEQPVHGGASALTRTKRGGIQ